MALNLPLHMPLNTPSAGRMGHMASAARLVWLGNLPPVVIKRSVALYLINTHAPDSQLPPHAALGALAGACNMPAAMLVQMLQGDDCFGLLGFPLSASSLVYLNADTMISRAFASHGNIHPGKLVPSNSSAPPAPSSSAAKGNSFKNSSNNRSRNNHAAGKRGGGQSAAAGEASHINQRSAPSAPGMLPACPDPPGFFFGPAATSSAPPLQWAPVAVPGDSSSHSRPLVQANMTCAAQLWGMPPPGMDMPPNMQPSVHGSLNPHSAGAGPQPPPGALTNSRNHHMISTSNAQLAPPPNAAFTATGNSGVAPVFLQVPAPPMWSVPAAAGVAGSGQGPAMLLAYPGGLPYAPAPPPPPAAAVQQHDGWGAELPAAAIMRQANNQQFNNQDGIRANRGRDSSGTVAAGGTVAAAGSGAASYAAGMIMSGNGVTAGPLTSTSSQQQGMHPCTPLATLPPTSHANNTSSDGNRPVFVQASAGFSKPDCNKSSGAGKGSSSSIVTTTTTDAVEALTGAMCGLLVGADSTTPQTLGTNTSTMFNILHMHACEAETPPQISMPSSDSWGSSSSSSEGASDVGTAASSKRDVPLPLEPLAPEGGVGVLAAKDSGGSSSSSATAPGTQGTAAGAASDLHGDQEGKAWLDNSNKLDQPPCLMYMLSGGCSKGASCPFNHSAALAAPAAGLPPKPHPPAPAALYVPVAVPVPLPTTEEGTAAERDA